MIYLQNGTKDILNVTILCLHFVLVVCRGVESSSIEPTEEEEKDFRDQV